MGIIVDRHTRVIVQGITGREGLFHAEKMLEYGTSVIAGVTPGKGGHRVLGVPVYNTVHEAATGHAIDATVIFVPPSLAADAMKEALDAGIKLVACITEGVPVHDVLKVLAMVREKKALLIGPNCPGIITAGETKLGILPGAIFTPGPVGVVSRSGTLTYLVVDELTRGGFGQSTCVGIGGDPVVGTSFTHILELFAHDAATRAVVIIGEIGGTQEEDAAVFLREHGIPAVAYIAGIHAPPEKKMGHAGAIISGGKGTAAAKIKAFTDAGVSVAPTVPDIVDLVGKIL
jgi:succinyl-CoA synthetase alpha subunit